MAEQKTPSRAEEILNIANEFETHLQSASENWHNQEKATQFLSSIPQYAQRISSLLSEDEISLLRSFKDTMYVIPVLPKDVKFLVDAKLVRYTSSGTALIDILGRAVLKILGE
jgi:capsular polysaccharide biosynthesis protein